MSRVKLSYQPDEREICVTHRHWITFVLRSWVQALAVVVAVGVLLMRIASREPDFLGRPPPLLDGLTIVLLLVMIGTLAWIMYNWFDWRNDHLIVTNKRIIHEERTLWLAYKYRTIPLERVQNVNVRISNIVQRFLQYGQIIVQAAGPSSSIVFDRVVCPTDIQRRIMDEVQREKRNQEQRRLKEAIDRHRHGYGPLPPAPSTAEDDTLLTQSVWRWLLPIEPIRQKGAIIWHRHWVVLLQNLLGPALAFAVWLGLLWFLPVFGWGDTRTATVGLTLGLLPVLGYAFWQYEKWRNYVYILEPSKIIDVERLPFGLYEDRREANLGMVQNVNATSANVVARILGYGDVVIETAGSAGNLTFDHIADPYQVQRLIFDYQERFKWRQREREWENTLSMLDLYFQAPNKGNAP